VGDLPGVSAVKVNYVKGTTHVEFDPATIAVDQIVDAIREAGYTAESAA
jgi:copper chaperone CopZ